MVRENRPWLLLIFEDMRHEELVKRMWFERMVDLAFVLDIQTQNVSNFYHGLVKSKGILNYCEIVKVV